MSPVLVIYFSDSSTRIRALAFGDEHTIAVTDKGRVFSWGDNEMGQLARISDGNENPHDLPRPVPGMEEEVIVQVCCSERSTLVLSETGAIYSWGDGTTIHAGPLHCSAVAWGSVCLGLRAQ
jgi:alpha-tubulin suppressor-like RCC1 family protein